jgi:hypothetical protein
MVFSVQKKSTPLRNRGDEAPAHFGNWPTEASLNSEVPTEAYLVKVTQNPNCRACKRGEITSEQYKVWNDGLSKMREGMLDHEIERRMEELNAKVLSLGSSNVVPLKRA